MGDFHKTDAHGEWMQFTTYVNSDWNRPQVTLLPMSHRAEPEFYAEVEHERVFADVYLFEGVDQPLGFLMSWVNSLKAYLSGLTPQGKTKWSLAKFFSTDGPSWSDYKRPHSHRAREAVYTKCECGEYDPGTVRYVWADLDRQQVLSVYQQTPMFFESSEEKDHADSVHEKKSPFEILQDARDAYLQKILKTEVELESNKNKHIIVEYGAAHMQDLHDLLCNDLGYKIFSNRNVLAIADNKDLKRQDPEFCGYGLAAKKWERQVASRTPSSLDWEALDAELPKYKSSSELKNVSQENMMSYTVSIDPVEDEAVKAYASLADNLKPGAKSVS